MATDLVAPLIPNAQENKGAELFLQGTHTGLAAAAQFAQMRRESENEMLKLAQQERMSQEQHEIEKMKIEAELPMYEAHAKYFDAMTALSLSKAKAYASGTATAAQRAIQFNQQREELVNDVNQQASQLKLDDPNFATKQPVQFAANVMQFEDMFSLSPLPEVKNAIRRYRTLADTQKIPLKIGATFDEEKGTWVGGGEPKMVPVWQVVRNMQDPARQDETMNALQASGHMKIIQDVQDMTAALKGGGTVTKKVNVTRAEPNPEIKGALDEGKGVQFQHVPSRVPSAMLPKSAATGTTPTELPEPDLPPDTTTDEPQASNKAFPPTDTDLTIQHAKNAIAKGASSAVVAQRLQQMGIDPGLLWNAAA
jgi:hypothetical protein